MKKLVREREFSPEELDRAAQFARKYDLTLTTVKLLFARGVDTEEALVRFLNPSKKNFLSPFLMSGMKEAIALIARARDEGWNVAVFGDYDADGIGACSILYRALLEYGIRPYLYIPERTDGYGMSVAAIDAIFDECLPDLFITVDCGISNREEVEYIKEQGAYVIVTDHHELPDVLPDCIRINPKIEDDYPYDNLCGAGVALKLAQALIGEKAHELLDFAALSTVADSVPLLGENRDIVSEGLKIIERNPRSAFTALLGKNAGEVTAQTLAFTVAPRINAAGRMGDAHAALNLFTSEDEEEIFRLAAQLNAYNLERQKCCDDVYTQAVAQIREKGAYGNVIMLVGEEWNSGFVGIVAARIAEEYARPALLFVRRGDMLKGSARSIESVNIFDALKACSEYVAEFGGHAQAAGVNVTAENFDALERALDEYIGQKYTREDFIPKVYISEEIEGAFPLKLARELNRLEPFGMGQRRPLFTIKAQATSAKPLKASSPHLSVSAGGMDFMYFGGAKHLRLLESDLNKTIAFECNLSKYRGKEYLKGFIRTVVYDGMSGSAVEAQAFEESLLSLRSADVPPTEALSLAEIDGYIRERREACAYGLCVIASDRASVARFPSLAGMDVEVFEPFSGSLSNTLLYAPVAGCDLSGYREIVFLETPSAIAVKTGGAKLVVCADVCGYEQMRSLCCTREELLKLYAYLRQKEGRAVGSSYTEAACALRERTVSPKQLAFALAVFDDLGLISLSEGKLQIVRGKKTELTDSPVYSAVLRLLGE